MKKKIQPDFFNVQKLEKHLKNGNSQVANEYILLSLLGLP